MKPPANSALALASAVVLTGLLIARLPPPAALLHPPSTPFDRSIAPGLATSFRLLQKAASVVPVGVSVVTQTEPPDPVADTYLYYETVALLPGRHVLPAALWSVPTPDLKRQADFVVSVGPARAANPGALLLSAPEGSVRRRKR